MAMVYNDGATRIRFDCVPSSASKSNMGRAMTLVMAFTIHTSNFFLKLSSMRMIRSKKYHHHHKNFKGEMLIQLLIYHLLFSSRCLRWGTLTKIDRPFASIQGERVKGLAALKWI